MKSNFVKENLVGCGFEGPVSLSQLDYSLRDFITKAIDDGIEPFRIVDALDRAKNIVKLAEKRANEK